MIKLFEFLIAGCWHKWTTTDEANYWSMSDDAIRPTGMVKICQCTKCGAYKRFNLY